MLSKTLSVALLVAVCQAQPLTKMFKSLTRMSLTTESQLLGHSANATDSLMKNQTDDYSVPVIPEEVSCVTKEFMWDNQEKLRYDPR